MLCAAMVDYKVSVYNAARDNNLAALKVSVCVRNGNFPGPDRMVSVNPRTSSQIAESINVASEKITDELRAVTTTYLFVYI